MSQQPILSIHNLTVVVCGIRLLHGIRLTVAEGQQITLAGASGSGKSTFLRCILGFVPIAEGEIRMQGQLLTAHSIWDVRGKLAYVAQEPELGEDTVLDALQRPFSYRMNKQLHFLQSEAEELLDALLLPRDILSNNLSALSGGEKQRIALTGALLLKRPLLLLDEAASALDGVSKQAVREYLCARTDLTILSVSHDTRDFSLSGPVFDIRQLAGNTIHDYD